MSWTLNGTCFNCLKATDCHSKKAFEDAIKQVHTITGHIGFGSLIPVCHDYDRAVTR